ncbi:cupin domain-containing protein [Serratia ureilytica]
MQQNLISVAIVLKPSTSASRGLCSCKIFMGRGYGSFIGSAGATEQPECVFGGLKAGGDWAVHFPAPQGGKFNAVVRGGCWLAAEGLAEPLWLAAGDCLLLTRSLPLTVGSDLSLPALDAEALSAGAKRRGALRRGNVPVYRRPF